MGLPRILVRRVIGSDLHHSGCIRAGILKLWPTVQAQSAIYKSNFIRTQPYLFIYVLSMAVFRLQWQNSWNSTEKVCQYLLHRIDSKGEREEVQWWKATTINQVRVTAEMVKNIRCWTYLKERTTIITMNNIKVLEWDEEDQSTTDYRGSLDNKFCMSKICNVMLSQMTPE